jgi:two-component system, OmpR family, response regulator
MTGGFRSRILVVEDEPSIADAVATALRDSRLGVEVCYDARTALIAVRTSSFDLVVLDVGLPDRSGFDVAQTIRDDAVETPILFLTARDSLLDKVRGLRVGDDYLTKPFAVVELVARIENLLRLTNRHVGDSILRCGPLSLDTSAHTVRAGLNDVRLTATEFRLLEFLMRNVDCVVSRQQILDAVWGYAFEGDDGVVETYVRYLRRKLSMLDRPVIETVRLVGYVLRSRPSKSRS